MNWLGHEYTMNNLVMNRRTYNQINTYIKKIVKKNNKKV